MLQQILDQMYIDPELLAELDEEQKQILFCKMRAEQVRRWKIREDQLEEEEKKIVHPKKTGGKRVTFLVGVDGEPVVVMLGGSDDVDTILEERARRQADLEADILKKAAEEELDKLVRLSRSTVEAMEEEATRNTNKERDPAREAVVRSLQEATVEMEGQIQALEEAESQQRRQGDEPSTSLTHSGEPSQLTRTSSGSSCSSSSSSGIGSLKSPLSSPSSSLSSLSSNSSSSSSQPPSPPAFSISSYGSSYTLTTKKLSGLSIWEVQGVKPSQATQIKPPVLSTKPTVTQSTKPHPPLLSSAPASSSSSTSVSFSTTSTSCPQPVVSSKSSSLSQPSPPSSVSSTTSTISSSLTPSPPLSLSPSSPRSPSPLTIVEKDEEVTRQSPPPSPHSSVVGVAAQIRRFEQLCEGSLEALKTATLERARRRRQREILEQLRSQVETARSLTPSEGDHKAWQEQERKAKEAEKRIREIARRAREEHRRAAHSNLPSSQPSSPAIPPTNSVVPAFQNNSLSSQIQTPSSHSATPTLIHNASQNGFIHNPTVINGDINGNIKSAAEDLSNNNRGGCVRHRVRPPKPPSRAAIATWFREEELLRGAGLDPTRSHIAPWFHGIISRTEAEEVLSGAGIGCFLVRVSERIWGYAISYRGPDRCRHYLIDVSGGRYTFFGSHQAAHSSLSDLVQYHQHEVITVTGGELLTRPCGQPNPLSPDYAELFAGTPYLPS